jgi:hypothetical protein
MAEENEAQVPVDVVDADDSAPALRWWERSAPLAAGAALVIGFAGIWYSGMLGRLPLDRQSAFAFMLLLPMLLIVPAFSLAALRLAWSAWRNRSAPARPIVMFAALGAAFVNLLALGRFAATLTRIFAA